MATSGVSFFAATRDQIITSALRKIAVLSENEVASAYQIENGAFVLNTVIHEAEVDGMPLWAIENYSIPLTSFSNGATGLGLGTTNSIPYPTKIINAFLRTTVPGSPESTTDIELMLVTKDEYNNITSKYSVGTPTQFYYDVKNGYGNLYIWPVPSTSIAQNRSIVITYQRPFYDAGTGTNTLDFPPYWTNALVYQLAMRLAPEYGVPPQDRTQLKQEAQYYWERALSFGTEEGSLFISPDAQRGGGGSTGSWGY